MDYTLESMFGIGGQVAVVTGAANGIAREVATTQPALIDAWSGPGHHSNGVQGGRAIALLNALVGGFDQPGRMLIPDRRGGAHTDFEPNEKAKATLANPRFDGVQDLPVGHGSGVYGRGFQRLLDDSGPYKPKVGICVSCISTMCGR